MTIRSSLPTRQNFGSAMAGLLTGTSLRAVVERLTAALPVRFSQFSPCNFQDLRGRNADSISDRRIGRRITRLFSGAGAALLLGAIFLLGDISSTSAGTLTFTFSHDGKQTFVTASGEVTFSSNRGNTPSSGSNTVQLDDTLGQFRLSRRSGHDRTSLRINGGIKKSKDISYEGKSNFKPDGYESPYHFYLRQDGTVHVDDDHVQNTTFKHNNGVVKFNGTLMETLGDDHFQFTLTFSNGNEKIVFRTSSTVAPAKPSGVKATPGDGKVTLEWQNPKNYSITKYQYAKKTGEGTFENWKDIDINDNPFTTSHTIDDLTNGTEYGFKVRAFNVSGTGEESESISATPAPTPRKPSGFRLEPSNTTIKLVWNNQSDDEVSIDKWQYQQKEGRDTDWPSSWTDISPSDKNTVEHQFSSLTNGTLYGYRIRAVATVDSVDRISPPSDGQYATPADEPEEATELTAEAGARRVTLSWKLETADPSIEEWQYQKIKGKDKEEADFANADWTPMEGSSATTRSHTVRDLEGDVDYSFRVRAKGYGGDGAASNIATATPEPGPSAEEEKRVLKQTMAAVAQATLASAVDTIGHRFDAAPRANTVTLAGRTVGGTQDTPEAAMASEDEETVFGTDPWADARLARDSMEPWNNAHLQAQRIDENSLLWNSGFTLALSENGSGGSGWTLWGRGDWLGFEGVDGTESWDGKQWTAWLGADTRMSERVMAGLAVSRGVVETDYTLDGEFEGTLETSLTAVWPYVQMTTGEGSAVRLVLGAGTGDAEHRGFDEEVEEASLSLIAGSVSGRFLMTRSGNASISAIGGASMAQIKTNGEAATSSIAGLKANSWRVRAGVEAAHDGYPMSSESGWMMAPRGSVSARQDGGDGVTGTGMEVSAGVRMTAPDGRISLDASGHWLAAHSKNGTKEWGASLEARMNAGADGRGLSLALGTDWGHQQQGGALTREKLFEDEQQTEPQGLSLSARSGYGFAMSGGLLTPFAEMAYGGDDARTRSLETGISFARGEFGASVTAGLRDSDDSASESRIGLELQLRY